jgi:putative transposase
MVGPAAVCQGVDHIRTVFEISERRACFIIQADHKTVRDRSCRPPETELRERLRSLASERRRFGYRRLLALLRREGEPSGKNRIYRLHREEGLTPPRHRHSGADPGRGQDQRPLVTGLRTFSCSPEARSGSS